MANSIIQEQILNPHNNSPLEDADTIGLDGIPGAGPFLQIYLKVQDRTITAAHFQTYTCPIAIACGSWLTHWAEGRSLEMAGKIETGDLMAILGGLPLGKEHCASLAVNALRSALRHLKKE